MRRRFARLKVFLSSVLRCQPSKRKLVFLVARHCVLVPNHHVIPELRSVSKDAFIQLILQEMNGHQSVGFSPRIPLSFPAAVIDSCFIRPSLR